MPSDSQDDILDRLMEEFSDSQEVCEILDGDVHDCKSLEAADINNGGLGSQLEYLLSCGYTEERLRELLNKEE